MPSLRQTHRSIFDGLSNFFRLFKAQTFLNCNFYFFKNFFFFANEYGINFFGDNDFLLQVLLFNL